MEKSIESEHFLKRVFTGEEIRYALGKACPARHFAGSFAAREAFSKASGISMYSVAFGGAWVERTSSGPVLRLSDAVRKLLPGAGEKRIHLSLTHDGEYAIAMVVMEVNE
jgi:holo-[acyl-carrier protein] synthase